MTLKETTATRVATRAGRLPRFREAGTPSTVNPITHNGHDLWDDISDALTEKDLFELRTALRDVAAHATEEKREPKNHQVYFDLSIDNPVFPEGLADDLSADLDSPHPLPRIHLHHHKRCLSEHTHLFYRDQAMATGGEMPGATEGDEELEWLLIGEAMKEGDVMDLRNKLSQIQKSVSSHQYGVSDIEAYLDGEMDHAAMEHFEEELAVNPELKNDLSLNVELEEAISEEDVISMRELLRKVSRQHNNPARELEEIDAFLDDAMTDKKRESFLEELSGSRELKREVELVRQIGNALGEKDVMELREQLREVAASESKLEGRSLMELAGRRKGIKQLVTFAAMFLLLLGISGIHTFTSLSGRDSYTAFYKAPSAPSSFRDAGTPDATGLTGGFRLYNQGHYASALLLLKEEAYAEPFNPAAVFYAGASYQGLREYNNAIAEYERIIQHRDNLFVEQAEWYRALSLVGKGSYRDAATNLGDVVKRRGFYLRQAEALLSRIEKRNP